MNANEMKQIADAATKNKAAILTKKADEERDYTISNIKKNAANGKYEFENRMSSELFPFFEPYLLELKEHGFLATTEPRGDMVSVIISWK